MGLPYSPDMISPNVFNLLAIANPCEDQASKTPMIAAFEDSAVIFLYSFITALIGVSLLDITPKALIAPFIGAALVGLTTYMRARGISAVPMA